MNKMIQTIKAIKMMNYRLKL